MVFAFLAAFFTGMALGGFLFAYEIQPVQIAANDARTPNFVPNGASSTTRH